MKRWRPTAPSLRATLAGIAWAALLLALPIAASAEKGWVRGAPLNLRTGAGSTFRILGVVAPGEGVTIVERGASWTQVRTDDGKQGWIAAGYLDPQAPPTTRVAQLEAQLARARAQLEKTSADAERLKTENESLSGDDSEQRSEIERLAKDNARLRAGERWAEWLTGALILSLGMAAGGILSRVGGRRAQRRIRL